MAFSLTIIDVPEEVLERTVAPISQDVYRWLWLFMLANRQNDLDPDLAPLTETGIAASFRARGDYPQMDESAVHVAILQLKKAGFIKSLFLGSETEI